MKATTIHPDKTASRAVDACGGTYTPEQEASRYADGHRDALEDAMKGVAAVDALMAEMMAALDACEALFTEIRNDWTDPRSECREGWAVIQAVREKAAGQ